MFTARVRTASQKRRKIASIAVSCFFMVGAVAAFFTIYRGIRAHESGLEDTPLIQLYFGSLLLVSGAYMTYEGIRRLYRVFRPIQTQDTQKGYQPVS